MRYVCCVFLIGLFVVCGCRSSPSAQADYEKKKAEYNKKQADWNFDNQRSQSAWSEATGGHFGGGTPLPKPKEPKAPGIFD